ncbi:sensor domain-containing phosphodiesterase [Salinisphaera sp. SPP-AMP-43]|uniref:putative bifunctional diguanylate cyclase/phosphodiesterase n=1 Tax=Salinisphaera sp. SPP-AMP-43 TaxID=3121288 RepID=UPI003C6E5549
MSRCPPSIARNESLRLAEVRALGLLDTPAEERFDRYTRLLSSVLSAPIALMTLVEESRQWAKSCIGTDLVELPREHCFCAHALDQSYLEIADAQLDARFCDNPLVLSAPYFRFYAGATINGPSGQPVGTICILDHQPRRLSDDEREQLIAFARLVEHELNQQSRFRSWANSVQYETLHDALTGLPDASLFEQQLAQALTEAAQQDQPLAVAQIRLTNFEALTTLEGRSGGDAALQSVAERLQQRLRSSDCIGRLGTDRLGMVIPNLGRPTDTAARIHKLVEGLIAPVEINGSFRPIRIAAGISCYPNDAVTAAGLLDLSDAAVDATSGEQIGVRFYSPAGHAFAARQHDQTFRLGEALQHNALQQFYQPIIDCRSQQLVGFEALARWHDDVYGQVSPAEFVPLAEAHPELCRELTRWSLEQACQQATCWRNDGQFFDYISVNVPSGELYRRDFIRLVTDILNHYRLPPECLTLEVTEQSLVADVDTAIDIMSALRRFGVRFAVDDFGTGYSSLRYLQQLPLDILKIDRSFIRPIIEDQITRKLTHGILQIADTLSLSVVAEGVETLDQLQILRQLGCSQAQGFLFSKPMAAEDIAFSAPAIEAAVG